jgi:ATP-binding cassette subfamily G (WHITE) protein 2
VVDILAALAREGTTVLLSIHQPRPDIFRLLSCLLLLTADGRVAYSGAGGEAAAAHFAALGCAPPPGVNIADFLLDAIVRATPAEVDRLVAGFSEAAAAGEEEAIDGQAMPPPPARSVPGFARQPCLLSLRQLRASLRHPLLFGLQ